MSFFLILLALLFSAHSAPQVATNLLGETVNYEFVTQAVSEGTNEVVLFLPDPRHDRRTFEHLAQTILVPSAALDLRGVGSNEHLGQGPGDAPLMHIDVLAVSKALSAAGYTRQSCVGYEFGGTLCAQAKRSGAAIERLIVVSPRMAVSGQSVVLALGSGNGEHILVMMGDKDPMSNRIANRLDESLVGIRYEVVNSRARGKDLLTSEPRLTALLRHWIHRSPDMNKTVHDLPRPQLSGALPEPERQQLELPQVELPEVSLDGANPDAARLREKMNAATEMERNPNSSEQKK